MKCSWHVTDFDIAAVEGLLDDTRDHPWLKDRFERNLSYPKKVITQPDFWRVFVCMRCTTLAASGEGSSVDRFQNLDPFPLLLDLVRSEPEATCEKLISTVLGHHKVGTHRRKIASDLFKSFNKLEQGRWPTILGTC